MTETPDNVDSKWFFPEEENEDDPEKVSVWMFPVIGPFIILISPFLLPVLPPWHGRTSAPTQSDTGVQSDAGA